MKLNSTILAVILTVCSNSAAWAQDWDMTPEAPVQVAVNVPAPVEMENQFENRMENRVDNRLEAANPLGFDLAALSALNAGGLGNTTQGYKAMPSMRTGNQSLSSLPQCTTAQFGYVVGGAGSLPPTSTDSFVANAGGQAETIYGDEGSNGIPPLSTFDTIDNGIQGQTAAGLTTGHHDGSLPSAWN